MISKKEGDIIYVKLVKGEEIVTSLYEVINKHSIVSGWINGIGAICKVELGFYNLRDKTYNKKKLDSEYELTSLMGNVSIKEGNSFLHLHVNISDESFNAYGGHLFSSEILVGGEFIIRETKSNIQREFDDNIGLFLWEFDHCEN